MKSRYIFNITLGAFLILALTKQGYGQVERSKEEIKSFLLNENASVSIENKYGDIIIEKWEKDSIRFDIKVRVNAKNDDNADALVDRIAFEGTNTGNFLTYRTVFNEYKGKKMKTFFRDLAQADKSNVSVDYIVYMPVNADLSINNKFGDVFLSEFDNDFRLTLSYGDVKAVALNSRADIKLSYGKANLKYVKDGELELKNSEAVMKEAGELTIDANGSDIEIGIVDEVVATVQRGDLKIDKARRVKLNGSFAGLTVEELDEQADLDIRLSTINLDGVSQSFELIKIKQQTSDVDINIKDIEFRLDAHMKGGDFSYPKVPTPFNKEYIDEKKDDRNITGILGQDPNAKVVIEGNSGRVRLYY